MRATVVVESQEEFDQWVSDQQQAATEGGSSGGGA
jgi:heme/copper-type cytochrome/quinol oxidase subunit 2